MTEVTATLGFPDVAIPGRSMEWTAPGGQRFVILLGAISTLPASDENIIDVAEVYTLTADGRVAAMSSVKDLKEAGFELEVVGEDTHGITEARFLELHQSGALTEMCHGWERTRA